MSSLLEDIEEHRERLIVSPAWDGDGDSDGELRAAHQRLDRVLHGHGSPASE